MNSSERKKLLELKALVHQALYAIRAEARAGDIKQVDILVDMFIGRLGLIIKWFS